MDDKKIDELINKALQEDLALPEGLSERLERRIDFLAQEEVSPRVSRRRSFYWISGIAAAILGALFLIFTETNRPAPTMADTFTDPEEAAVVAQNALAFMSRNLNKGLGQVNEAGQEITKINKIVCGYGRCYFRIYLQEDVSDDAGHGNRRTQPCQSERENRIPANTHHPKSGFEGTNARGAQSLDRKGP